MEPKATVISLHFHPHFQNRRRLQELKSALLAETLAFAQIALESLEGPGGAGSRGEAILTRARTLLEEARNRLILEISDRA